MPGVVLAALMTACGNGDDPGRLTPEERGLAELRSQDSYFEHVSDDAIIGLADRMCAAMDRGETLDDLNQGRFGLEVTQEQVPMVFAFAIETRCPEHNDLLPPTP